MGKLAAAGSLYLSPISGPPIDPIELPAKAEGVTVGRHEQCDRLFPADAQKVSRYHARFHRDGDQWLVTDLNSRWGTFVNGVKLTPGLAVGLSEGDLLRISPWTFSLGDHDRASGVQASEDDGHTLIQTIAPGNSARLEPAADDALALLLEAAAAIHSARGEKELAERVIDFAVRGTGMRNAAVLRPLNTRGRLEVLASTGPTGSDGGFTFSRSLVARAAEGQIARIESGAGGVDDAMQSIVTMKITAALCIPLMLDESPAALLYVDARGPLPTKLRARAVEFCVALASIASLALANSKRADMQKRAAVLEADLCSAAAAQKWVLPKRTSGSPPFQCLGECRPGTYVGGDFFDVIDLGAGRLAVAVGDVSGKGVSASVLMTATQGFLNAALIDHGDPARAVTAVNRFVHPRRPADRFVTMWVGVFDLHKQTLDYVDAGHSYAALHDVTGTVQRLDAGDGLPVGLMEDTDYLSVSVALPEHGRVIVVSDGAIEQPEGGVPVQHAEQFGMDRVMKLLAASSQKTEKAEQGDLVSDLFAALYQHAGSERLADDATALYIRWDGSAA